MGHHRYKQTAMGFGKRFDFTKKNVTPGPDYEAHNISSISGSVSKRNRKSNHHGFGCKWDDYDKVMYEGMEGCYMLKHSPAVGIYKSRIVNDKERNSSRFSLPKSKRGIIE